MLSLPDFSSIAYLRNGSPIQQKAFNILHESKILYHLRAHRPVLAGTLPLDVFIEGKSDLDIICEAADLKSVEEILLTHYADASGFQIIREKVGSRETTICRFILDKFPVEIFCQYEKVENQPAYRHMVVEYGLLLQHGEGFKAVIRNLKEAGMKTEPAFAFALGLEGNPYEVLLNLEGLDKRRP